VNPSGRKPPDRIVSLLNRIACARDHPDPLARDGLIATLIGLGFRRDEAERIVVRALRGVESDGPAQPRG
jgi:hypothetical protein